MKKVLLALVLAALCNGAFLFAQDTTPKYRESEYYYYNFTIEKIYASRLGFMVVYRRGANQFARTYVPHEWFNTIGGKGEIVYLGSGSEWPSLIVYYKDGEFSHVRLRLRRDRSHETWGVVPLNVNIDEHFQDLEEVRLQF